VSLPSNFLEIEMKYTIEHRGGCVLIAGPVPAGDFDHLAGLVGDGAVLCADVARMGGVTFAIGLREDLEKLREALATEVTQRERQNLVLSATATSWLITGRRGGSSDTMFSRLTGVDVLRGHSGNHPIDPDDLDRCLSLLYVVPELRPLLRNMSDVSPQWAALVDRWDEVESSHLNEAGLGWTKARSAPRTYALMQDILARSRAQGVKS
jgi:hypothetical protein